MRWIRSSPRLVERMSGWCLALFAGLGAIACAAEPVLESTAANGSGGTGGSSTGGSSAGSQSAGGAGARQGSDAGGQGGAGSDAGGQGGAGACGGSQSSGAAGSGAVGPVCATRPYPEAPPAEQLGAPPGVTWARSWGTAGQEFARRTAALPDGGVVVLKSRVVALSHEVGEEVPESAMALRPDGSAAWETALPAEHVGSDARGNVYTALDFEGEVRIGSETLTACGRRGIAITGLDAGGTIAWVRELGSGDLGLTAFAVHNDGSSLVAGFFQGALTIAEQAHQAPPGVAIGFLAALDAAGRILWSRASADGSLSSINAVALGNGGTLLTSGLRVFELDAAGNVVQSHALGIDGHTALAASSEGGFVLGWIAAEGALLASYDESGVRQWGRNLGDFSYLPSVAIGPAGEIVALVGSAAEPRTRLMAFDAAGEPVWSWSFTNVVPPNASLLSTTSALFLSGSFTARTDLGGTTLESVGCDDGFIAQLR